MYSIPAFTLVKVRGYDDPCETVSRACPVTGQTYVREVPGDPSTAKHVPTQDIQGHCDGCAMNYSLTLCPKTTGIVGGMLASLCTDCAGKAGL